VGGEKGVELLHAIFLFKSRYAQTVMEKRTKNKIANTGSAMLAVGSGPATIIGVAEGATSASAITSALATIGFGSMLIGTAVIGAGSLAVFFGARWCLRRVFR